MGDRDNPWGQEPEVIFSAAVLRVDTMLIENFVANTGGPLNARTGIPAANGSDLTDANNFALGDPQLAVSMAEFISQTADAGRTVPNPLAQFFYNPQVPSAPLTLFATGVRNAYDLVWHSNGQLYVPTNGSASGGVTPPTPSGAVQGDPSTWPVECFNRVDNTVYGPYLGPIAPRTQPPTQYDYLYRVVQNGYYGHPNPTRCEYVINGGNPTAGVDPGQVGNHYPVGTQPDRNYRYFAYDFQNNKSPNGVIEYQNSAVFGGRLAGQLLVVRYSQGKDIITLQPGGADVGYNIVGDILGNQIPSFSGFNNPLDLTENPAMGDIYLIEYGNGTNAVITLLRPEVVNEPDIVVNPETIIFDDVIGGPASAPQTVTIINAGAQPLNLTGFTFSGAFALAAGETVPSPATPIVVPGEGSVTVDVVFNPTTIGVQVGEMAIASNDPDSPTVTVELRGLGKQGLLGTNEPSLQWITDTYDLLINVGDNNPATPIINSTTPSAPLLGEEVEAQTFRVPESGPVTLELLGVFAPNSNPVLALGWYEVGNAAGRTEVLSVNSGSNQTLNPTVIELTGDGLSFSPGVGTEFSFFTRWPSVANREVFGEDALNSFGGAIPHHMRVYPIMGQPNAYLIAFEEATTGFEYQDVVFIARNLRPTQDFQGNIALVPDELTFASTLVGGISAPQVLTIQNTGGSPLTLTDITVNGPFSLVTTVNTPVLLPAGANLPVQLVFAPVAPGPVSGSLEIMSDDPNDPTVSVTLNGTGTEQSGEIAFENLDWDTLNSLNIPEMQWVNTWLTFYQLLNNPIPYYEHPRATLRIRNVGTQPLEISDLTIVQPSGTNNPTSGEFVLPNGEDPSTALPLVILPGGFYDLAVDFVKNGGSGPSARIGQLLITSNDPNSPVSEIGLGGGYMTNSQGGAELTLQQIVDVFGYSTDIGEPINDALPTAYGEEWLGFLWDAQQSGQQIYVRQLAAFHGCCGGIPITLDLPGVTGEPPLFVHDGPSSQSLFPLIAGGTGPAEALVLSPGEFVFNVTTYTNSTRPQIGVRTWPVRDPDGNIVPGTWIVGHDNVSGTGNGCNTGGANCDYNDDVYLVTNVAPLNAAPDVSVSISTPADTHLLGSGAIPYTVTVENETPFTALNAQMTFSLPLSVTLDSFSTTAGTCSALGSLITCQYATLNGGQVATLSVNLIPNGAGVRNSSALVPTVAGETVTGNNSDANTVTVVDPNALPGTITVVKEATPESAQSFDFDGDLGPFSLEDSGALPPIEVLVNFDNAAANGAPVALPGRDPWDINDTGPAFGAMATVDGTSYTYGWRNFLTDAPVVATPNARDRGGNTPTSTFIHMAYSDCCTGSGLTHPVYWEIALPNGTYTVTISAGDPGGTAAWNGTPGHGGANHRVSAEGVLVVSANGGAGTVGTASITVTDGFLTLTPEGPSQYNTKIQYVLIEGSPIAPNSTTFTGVLPGAYRIFEVLPAGFDITGASCTGNSVPTSPITDGVRVTLSSGEDITCTFTNAEITAPAVRIEKTPALQELVAGDDADFTITVTNIGTEDLNNVVISDPLTPDCADTFASLAVGATETYTCTASDVATTFVNEARVTADPVGGGAPVTDVAYAEVRVGTPALTIEKTPDGQAINRGDTANFTILVQNTGDLNLTNVTVSDPVAPDCDRALGTLQPDQTAQYDCQLPNVLFPLNNIAEVTGEYGTGTVSATDTAVVSVPSVTYVPTYRVNAGGPEIPATDGGPAWSADTTGAPSPFLAAGPQNQAGARFPVPTYGIPGVPDTVIATERWDPVGENPLTYTFPLTDAGEYEVRLYFAELFYGVSGPGTVDRIFDVFINGVLVIDNLNLLDTYGNDAVPFVFPVTLANPGDDIVIEVLHGPAENPKINALEILQVLPPTTSTLSVAPTLIDFGAVSPLLPVPDEFITLTNLGLLGDPSIEITNITLGGPDAAAFSVSPSGAAPGLLLPGEATDSLTVGFTPGAFGNYSAFIDIEHNGTNPSPIRVNLVASVQDIPLPDLVFTPSTLDFALPEDGGTDSATVGIATTGDTTTYTIDTSGFPSWLSWAPARRRAPLLMWARRPRSTSRWT
ncbi:MAG: choice-of-anchor D domain-containing protein [Anaerolineae bacterium]|nr:choice-of-anchor D domain-containing protein [Anaerolineae bacterium]